MINFKVSLSVAVLVCSCAVSANPFIKEHKSSPSASESIFKPFFGGEQANAVQEPAEKPGPEVVKPVSVEEPVSVEKLVTVEKPASIEKPVSEVKEITKTKEQEPTAQEKRQSKITSKKTFYDRREGVAYFEGDVFVDDSQYKLHADKVYVFLDGTNDLRRIVAMGNVAMTNGLKRAYAHKASYYKCNGMVVLSSGENTLAEVYDDSKGDSQSVKGSKIRFWTSADQVEVIDANISAPTKGGIKGGFGNLKDALGK